MDMAEIGPKDGLMAEKAAHDGQSRIEERNGKGHEGGGHAEDGGGFLAPEQGKAAEEEADQETTAVAQKDSGGVEIVAQETE